MYFYLPALCAVYKHVLNRLGQILKRGIQAEMVFFRQSVQNRPSKAAFILAGLPAQHHNGPVQNAQRFVRYHQIRIKFHLVAQSQTVRAGAERIIKGKAAGLYLFNTDPAVRAGKILAEVNHLILRLFPGHFLTVCLTGGIGRPLHIHHRQPFRQIHHLLQRFGQPLFNTRLHNQPVHQDLDIMLNIFIQFNLF